MIYSFYLSQDQSTLIKVITIGGCSNPNYIQITFYSLQLSQALNAFSSVIFSSSLQIGCELHLIC